MIKYSHILGFALVKTTPQSHPYTPITLSPIKMGNDETHQHNHAQNGFIITGLMKTTPRMFRNFSCPKCGSCQSAGWKALTIRVASGQRGRKRSYDSAIFIYGNSASYSSCLLSPTVIPVACCLLQLFQLPVVSYSYSSCLLSSTVTQLSVWCSQWSQLSYQSAPQVPLPSQG